MSWLKIHFSKTLQIVESIEIVTAQKPRTLFEYWNYAGEIDTIWWKLPLMIKRTIYLQCRAQFLIGMDEPFQSQTISLNPDLRASNWDFYFRDLRDWKLCAKVWERQEVDLLSDLGSCEAKLRGILETEIGCLYCLLSTSLIHILASRILYFALRRSNKSKLV